ncbi:hypothetical protein B0H11DRAFT_2339484 [Mycena galericulata]|nr:hypothetical protein B0H11DRAFT_2339484 [Mycena galericulata]
MSKGQKDSKSSSLPSSLHDHLYSGPQRPHGPSPTASIGGQEEAELPPQSFEPSRPPTFPLRPLAPSPLPAPFPDIRRHDPVGLRSSAELPSPERPVGPSSIPHGSRYRSPVVSDPVYPAPGRPHGPPYPGSHSLPPVLPQSNAWREGEAGPSSLAHSYGGISRRISPPQQIYRRATEPGGYTTIPPVVQPSLHGSYERLRPQEERFRPQEERFRPQEERFRPQEDRFRPQEDRFRTQELPAYPSRATAEIPYAESSQASLSLPPLYAPHGADWPPYGAPGGPRHGEQEDLPPLYSAIQSHSSASSDYTRADDGDYLRQPRGVRRRADSEFESNPRRTNIPKKILVACDFCRHRKLKCDGLRPACGNCTAREQNCKYAPHPKRRGPGKAAKGARAKKRVQSKGDRRSESSSSQAAPGSADDFDVQTLVDPELRTHRSFESGMQIRLATTVTRENATAKKTDFEELEIARQVRDITPPRPTGIRTGDGEDQREVYPHNNLARTRDTNALKLSLFPPMTVLRFSLRYSLLSVLAPFLQSFVLGTPSLIVR